MQPAKKAIKRGEYRVQVLPIEIKGILSSEEAAPERQIPFLVWDVSANGVGILISDRLQSGEVLRLTFGNPFTLSVLCSVVWCDLQEADYDFQEPSFRVGLITVGNNKILQPIVDRVDAALKPQK